MALVEAEEASAALGDRWEAQAREGALRSARRARKRLFELVMCNDFDLMITLTLDASKIDRYDVAVVTKKLNTWLDNKVRRRGLRYVITPELHKDGAIHFHGFINSDAVRLVDSGRRNKGQSIFNLPDWKYGFTTAVRLYGERQHAAAYITKYITKQLEGGHKIGGRYFYHGGDLCDPVVHLFDWEARPEGYEVELPEAGLTLVYVDKTTTKKER